MAKRAGQFDKQITNARNSNENFNVKVEDDNNGSRPKRVSASHLKSTIIHGTGTKKHFTTITPQGLPPDLIGDEDSLVERQNVLIEPKGYRNEAARLPSFKPFKTISDEDNIHLLPGETGERARLNLLDTKAVTKKDVEETRKVYEKHRKQYPELYRKQQVAVVDDGEDPQQQKKKGFFGKFFGKKKSLLQPPPPQQPPPEELPLEPPPLPENGEEPVPEEEQPFEPKKSLAPSPTPSLPKKASKSRRSTLVSSKRKSERSPTPSESEEEETSESSESSSEEDEEEGWGYGQPGPGGMMPYYGGGMGGYPYPAPGGYPQPQYPGMPGGYSPYFNPYAGGFGPTQMPPQGNSPCMEEMQIECCRKMLKERKDKGQGDAKRKPKKAQGLNFDFLPHDDLATEVTMVIEPDEPEPLQFAVENGIMPIICCYMPSSLAVQQAPNYQPSSVQAYSNSRSSGSTTYGYGSSSASYGYGYGSGPTSYGTGNTQFTSTKDTNELSLPPLKEEEDEGDFEEIDPDNI